MAFQSFHWNNMEKPLVLQGKITMLQQLFAKSWLQHGRASCQTKSLALT